MDHPNLKSEASLHLRRLIVGIHYDHDANLPLAIKVLVLQQMMQLRVNEAMNITFVFA